MNALINSFPVPETHAAPANGWLQLAAYSLTVAVPAAVVSFIPPVQIPAEAVGNHAKGAGDRERITGTAHNSAGLELRHTLFAPLPAPLIEVSAAVDGALRTALRSSTKLIELL